MQLIRLARSFVTAISVFAFVETIPNSSAQNVITLIDFNSVWRYDQSDTDWGTAWRDPGFDDSGWASGPGLIQGGEATFYPVPFRTTIAPSVGKTTHYFRTTFVGPTSTNGLQIFATNFVDDGCVLWLNGVEAGRIRMPAGVPVHSTRASDEAAVEGQIDMVMLNPALILPNQINTLAVEVHQIDAESFDVVWGTHVKAYQPTELSFTRQPQSQTVRRGDFVTFGAEVSGGPAFYQWQKDEIDIANATNATFSMFRAEPGNFRVIVTNALSRLVSSNALLTVSLDPRPFIRTAALREDFGGTNVIEITFDETLRGPFNPDDIKIIRSGTFGANAIAVDTSQIVLGGRTIRVRVGGPNWDPAKNYYLLINNFTDSRGNKIAPLSVFPITIRGRVGSVPANGPADLLRLTAQVLPGNPPRIQLNWTSNANHVYYGYNLVESKVLPNSVPPYFSTLVSSQANGVIVPASDEVRFYRLERGPHSGR